MKKTLSEYVNLEKASVDPQNYIGAPKACGLCGSSFSSQEFLVDGALQATSAGWAIMCESCFYLKGKGIGWGVGQLYLKQPNGKWLWVGGFR